MSRVPSLDLGMFRSGSHDDRKVLAAQLAGACEEHGFFVFHNHGISAHQMACFKQAVADLFGLGEETLSKYERPETDRQRGYTPFGIEIAEGATAADLKHFYHIGPEHVPGLPPNVWPRELPQLKRIVTDMYRELSIQGDIALSLLEINWNLTPGSLAELTIHGDSVLRLLHYPAIKPGMQGPRAGAHRDIAAITALIAGTKPGLQLMSKKDGWIPVEEGPDTIVCNLGDTLVMLLANLYQIFLVSTTHRVVSNEEGERFSFPFFKHFWNQVVIDPETGFTVLDYLNYRLAQNNQKRADLATLPAPRIINPAIFN